MQVSRAIAAATMAVGLLLVAGGAGAADDPGVIPLTVNVGESVPVGPGPVRNLICDDPGLVQPVDAADGPSLLGVRAGTTLCSVTDALSVRRTYRVVVVEAGRSPPQPGQGR